MFLCVARIAGAADRPTNHGAGHSRGCAAGRSRGRATRRRRGCGGAAAGPSRDYSDDEAPFLSYDDDDVSNVLPSFDSSCVGFQLPGHYTRGSLTEAINFFDMFFTDNMISDIVSHTNSYVSMLYTCSTASNFQTYNLKMNTVDRSDQILSTFNIQRKCLRWWKTLFFHLIDIAVVNSYILFLEHQAKNPDDIKRPRGYNQCDFRDEIVRQICNFDEYGDPPLHITGRPSAPPSVFETEHIPRASNTRRNCVVCYKQDKVERKTNNYCSAPQCEGKHMHITQERNCFGIFHSKEYHNQ